VPWTDPEPPALGLHPALTGIDNSSTAAGEAVSEQLLAALDAPASLTLLTPPQVLPESCRGTQKPGDACQHLPPQAPRRPAARTSPPTSLHSHIRPF
jgi:hypothetical protein